MRRTIKRLIDWLDRLRTEMEGIPVREPYLSAIQMLEQYTEDSSYELSLQHVTRQLLRHMKSSMNK